MPQEPIDEEKGVAWARAKPTATQKIGIYFGRIWHIGLTGRTPTLLSAIWFILRLSLVPAIASIPLLPRWFEGEQATYEYAWWYFIATVALLSLRWVFEKVDQRFRVDSAAKKHKDGTALEQRALFTEMASFVNVTEPNFDNHPFVRLIDRTLKATHDKVLEEIGTLDADFLQVSLMVFAEAEKIEVVARAGSPRQVRKTTDRNRTMAYFVAKERLSFKMVPDLKRDQVFVHEGVSEPECPYRSVLLIPVTNEVDSEVRGVITIDSKRAYEFWNENAAENIFLQVMPFVRLAAILLQGHEETV